MFSLFIFPWNALGWYRRSCDPKVSYSGHRWVHKNDQIQYTQIMTVLFTTFLPPWSTNCSAFHCRNSEKHQLSSQLPWKLFFMSFPNAGCYCSPYSTGVHRRLKWAMSIGCFCSTKTYLPPQNAIITYKYRQILYIILIIIKQEDSKPLV